MRTGERIALAAAVLVGIAAGLGVFTFAYARGSSYLTNDPAACANCHIMSEHFTAWTKSSHRSVATCNDCHTPHALIPKYAVKAKNGFWHSFYFTLGGYPDPLRITEGNREVTEHACRGCHGEITEAIEAGRTDPGEPVGSDARAVAARARGGAGPAVAADPHAGAVGDESISCIRCHKYVGHWVR
jgi:cytochrome c nitrite reductase small subunit